MKTSYKKEWQEYYGEYPYTETDEKQDLSPEEFAKSMMEVFKASGVLNLIEKEKISILASSVSAGKKDWEFLKHLDDYLDKLKTFQRPSIVLTDFALTKERKSVIKKPGQTYKNLDFHVTACDSYNLPFRENEFQVLYERLGALYHAADEDITKKTEGKFTQEILEEYKRVVAPDGQIIIDWINSRVPVSTAEEINKATKQDVEIFFKNLGFKVEFAGKNEGFIILTNQKAQKFESTNNT